VEDGDAADWRERLRAALEEFQRHMDDRLRLIAEQGRLLEDALVAAEHARAGCRAAERALLGGARAS
jgi:hypothetical protein